MNIHDIPVSCRDGDVQGPNLCHQKMREAQPILTINEYVYCLRMISQAMAMVVSSYQISWACWIR